MSQRLVHAQQNRNKLRQLDKIYRHNVDAARSTVLTTQPVEERVEGLTGERVGQCLIEVRHDERAVRGEHSLRDVERVAARGRPARGQVVVDGRHHGQDSWQCRATVQGCTRPATAGSVAGRPRHCLSLIHI